MVFRDEIPEKREPIGPASRREYSFWSAEVHSHATLATGTYLEARCTCDHVLTGTRSQAKEALNARPSLRGHPAQPGLYLVMHLQYFNF